ncbi:MAG TPA: hypothetical protein VJV79_33985 [Polyangiaceae bacterium]|nr:hypothetical protein [Polyangiaceae bacterium]
MKVDLQSLLQPLEQSSVGVGNSQETIAGCERRLGISLPSWLNDLYLEQDGIRASSSERAYVLPVERATDLSVGFCKLGVFVIAEEESDVVVQMLDGPLQGYIAKIPHDGERGPLYRNEREYLQEISAALRRGQTALRDLAPACGGRRSNDDDHARASALVTSEAPRPSSERRRFQLQMAVSLLGSHQAEAFLTVLDDEDLYVRESAEDSLRQLADPPARQLLSTYASSCKQFELRCKRLVESTGGEIFEATQRSTTATWTAIAVRGTSGKLHWLSLAGFYGRRMDPSFDAWFCERIRGLR